jgi:hypothetical protein
LLAAGIVSWDADDRKGALIPPDEKIFRTGPNWRGGNRPLWMWLLFNIKNPPARMDAYDSLTEPKSETLVAKRRASPEQSVQLGVSLGRIRKRDPRLTKANFWKEVKNHKESGPCVRYLRGENNPVSYNRPKGCYVEWLAIIWKRWDGKTETLAKRLPGQHAIENHWDDHPPES